MKSTFLPAKKLTWIVIVWILTHAMVGIPVAQFEHDIILEKNRDNFLTSSIVVLAAITGIVFSISLVVIQNTASNYSPTILDMFKKDHFVAFTLSYGLFTIMFISTTILFGWATILECWIFFFWDLGLLAIYLYYTLNKINPLYIIDEIKTSTKHYLNDIPKKINDIGQNERIEDKTGKINYLHENFDPSIISGVILKSHSDLIKQVRNYEVTLQHIILGSFRKDDYETSTAGLNVYPMLVENYLKINPKASWYNDEFLQIILQRFDVYADKTISQNNLEFLMEVIESCKNVGKNLVNIPTSGFGSDYVQPLALCIGVLTRIGQKALGAKMFDATRASIVAIRELGQIGLIMHKNDHLSPNKILEISNMTLEMKEAYTTSICISQLFILVQTMIATIRSDHITIELTNLTNLLQKYLQNRLSDYFVIGLFSDMSKVGVIPCVEQALLLKNGEFPKIETRAREEDEKKIISAIIKMLASLSNRSGMQNTLVAKDCADNLVHLATLCVKEQFRTFNDGHKEELLKIISALMSIYHYDPQSHSILGNEIVSNIMEVGVLCASCGYVEIAELCVDRINFLSSKVLELDEHGFEANLIMRELNILGCYSVMTSNNKLLDKITSTIVQFDEKFEQKYGRTASDYLNLDAPLYTEDRFERRYRYIETDVIMQINNRAQFEAYVLTQEIAHFKNKLSKNNRN